MKVPVRFIDATGGFEDWLRPARPQVLSPTDGETDIGPVPMVVGSPYAHAFEVPMRGRHIQIATDAAFASIVWEDEGLSSSVAFQVPLKSDGTPHLAEGEQYVVRVRYQDRAGKWSEWSAPVTFTTMAAFPATMLLAPTMMLPPDGGEMSATSPMLGMSEPKVMMGTASFDAADWQVSADRTFATTLYEATETTDMLTHRCDGLRLASALGSEFFVRGRQRTTGGEWTPWAYPARATIRTGYTDPIFGMRRVFNKTYERPLVYHIDADGDVIDLPKEYFDAHPLYQFPTQEFHIGETSAGASVDSQCALVAPCWIKHAVYDDADGNMTIDLWFSPAPVTGDGWMLHPAFASDPGGFWHGTCVAARAQSVTAPGVSGSKNVLFSAPGTTGALGSETTNDALLTSTSMLEGGAWRHWTLYERRLLLDLMMAEHRTFDAKKISTGTGASNTDAAFRWRSFFGLVEGAFTGGVKGIFKLGKLGLHDAPDAEGVTRRLWIQTPTGDNDVAVDVEIKAGENVTEVARGYRAELGFDIALLGLPSRTSATEGGGRFGFDKGIDLARTASPTAIGTEYVFSGMFLCVPRAYAGSGTQYARISRSM
ncbi:MAG: fibronectin type III domain-containing protein [Synergistaceae bacterium]|nr:fibronectin type III domain-containing protein [Synergistaceae bacterium]